jgi:hypothetical protein
LPLLPLERLELELELLRAGESTWGCGGKEAEEEDMPLPVDVGERPEDPPPSTSSE